MNLDVQVSYRGRCSTLWQEQYFVDLAVLFRGRWNTLKCGFRGRRNFVDLEVAGTMLVDLEDFVAGTELCGP